MHDSGVWGEEPDGSRSCFPVLRSNNIQNGEIVFGDVAVRKIPEEITKIKALKLGDILVVTSSGSRDLLGKSALFVPPANSKAHLFSNFTLRLRPKPNVIEPLFLHLYLQSPEEREVLHELQDTTTGLRNLDRKAFLNQQMPLPCLDEQRRIAARLSEQMAHAEKLRQAAEAQLKAINALPGALLEEIFGAYESPL